MAIRLSSKLSFSFNMFIVSAKRLVRSAFYLVHIF